MDWEKIKTGLIDKGIVALLAGALGAVYTGSQNGKIGATVNEIKTTVDKMEAEREREKLYHACTVRMIDWLHTGSKGEKPCNLE